MQAFRLRTIRGTLPALLLLQVACPPPPCSEEELRDLRYEEHVVAGEPGRVVFERLGFPVSGCTPPRAMSIVAYPAERTWVIVEVPGLARRTITPPLLAQTFGIVSDARVAVITDGLENTVMLRHLDTGEEQLLVQGGTSYSYASAVARPYILMNGTDGPRLLNVDSGESLPLPPSMRRAALSPHTLAYAEPIHPDYFTDLTSRLVARDLVTSQEVILREAVPHLGLMRTFGMQIAWTEKSADGATETVHLQDLTSGAGGQVELPAISSDSGSITVADLGPAGALVLRRESGATLSDPDLLFLDLVSYPGTSRGIDGVEQPSGMLLEARFAGPYVVYRRNGNWIIYDPAGDVKHPIDPFTAP